MESCAFGCITLKRTWYCFSNISAKNQLLELYHEKMSENQKKYQFVVLKKCQLSERPRNVEKVFQIKRDESE